MRDYEERIAIYDITGGSVMELPVENVADYEYFNSADEGWMPIRKLEKKIDRSDYQFEKDFQGKISIHDFKLLKKIAEGAYGAVYLVQMKETEEYFAMKVIDYIQGFKHS